MRKSSLKIAPALKPLSSLVSQHDFFRIRFHERSGTVASVTGQRNGVAFSSSPTITGSPAATVWTANAGFMTPEGDNLINLGGIADVAEICKQANYPNGGILLLSTVQHESNPNDSSYHTILSVNADSGSDGHYALKVDSFATPHARLTTRAVGAGSSTNTVVGLTALSVPVPVTAYINNVVPASTVLGVTGNTAAHTVLNPGNLKVATINGTGIAALAVNVSSPIDYMNSGAGGGGWKIHDIWAIAFDTDEFATGLVSRIIAEYAATPYENLRSLA